MLDAARNMPCIRCGKVGETRACHYNGPRQHDFGKGRGQKCSDLMTSEFCDDCDRVFSEGKCVVNAPPIEAKWVRSEDFLYWIAMTNIRRIENGWFTN